MEKQNFVVLKNICKRFGNNTVIGNLDLEIKKGSLVTLLGPSGCGKT
ncbi:MAG: ABC transporter ATP-binding protein, partial [Vibrionaceae bacterium]